MQTILVIEPDDGARDALVTMLAGEGYVVVPTRDAREAERHLSTSAPPELVIVDSDGDPGSILPGVLHARESLRDVPVVVLSAKPYTSRFSYAVAFFMKPVKPDDLLAKVREWVRDSCGGKVTPRKAPASGGRTRD